MAWDLNSPLFIHENILYIPSCFVSWTGEALDYRTPLMRSNQAVAREALRVLSHLGDKNVKEVVSNVGWEQEVSGSCVCCAHCVSPTSRLHPRSNIPPHSSL